MRLLSTLLALALVACSGESTETANSSQDTKTVANSSQDTKTVEVASQVRPVACGCSLESVGKCGNYVAIDGKHHEIANSEDLGLGHMEWCGQDGIQAQSAGRLEGGQFIATEMVVQGK